MCNREGERWRKEEKIKEKGESESMHNPHNLASSDLKKVGEHCTMTCGRMSLDGSREKEIEIQGKGQFTEKCKWFAVEARPCIALYYEIGSALQNKDNLKCTCYVALCLTH